MVQDEVFLVEHDDLNRLSRDNPEPDEDRSTGSVCSQDEPVMLRSFIPFPE